MPVSVETSSLKYDRPHEGVAAGDMTDDQLLQRRPHRWIDRWEPEDPIFCTLPSRTWVRNVGLYGTVTERSRPGANSATSR